MEQDTTRNALAVVAEAVKLLNEARRGICGGDPGWVIPTWVIPSLGFRG